MSNPCVLAGRVTAEGKLELEEQVPVPPGPVRVSIESLAAPSVSSLLLLSDEECERRRKMLASLVGCISDEEAREMIKIVEEEFEQIDSDDWR